MPIDTHAEPWKRTTPLFLGHLVNDAYASFFAPLLPLLIDRLDLSLTIVGVLGTLRLVTNSLTQPFLGQLVDRIRQPLLVVFGPILTICAMGFIGRVESLGQLIGVLIIAGIGTALFHPTAASLVPARGEKNRSLIMAFFSSGGTVGAALAPLVIVAYVGAFGMARTPWLILPAIATLSGIAVAVLRASPTDRMHKADQSISGGRTLPAMLVLLWFVILLRSLTAITFLNFLAVLITQRGGSVLLGGAAITVFLLTGAVGGFLAGSLAGRIGPKWIILSGVSLATPFFLLFLHGPTALSFVFLAAAGLAVFSSVPVGVVAAQELLPGRTGLVSGLVMGLAWGVGGLALTPIGWLADRFGLVPVMTWVAFLPLIAGGLVLFYREENTS